MSQSTIDLRETAPVSHGAESPAMHDGDDHLKAEQVSPITKSFLHDAMDHQVMKSTNDNISSNLKGEQASPITKSFLHDAIDHQAMTSTDDNFSTDNTTPEESPNEVKQATVSDTISLSPMITRSRGAAAKNKLNARASPSPKVKESPTQSRRVAKRKSENKRRYHIKLDVSKSPKAVSQLHSSVDEALNGTNQFSAAKANNHERLKQANDAALDSVDSDSSIEQLEIEQGASNLFSLMQEADATASDDEYHYGGNRKGSPKPHNTKAKKARSDFLSTVLNNNKPATPGFLNGFPTPSFPNGFPSLAEGFPSSTELDTADLKPVTPSSTRAKRTKPTKRSPPPTPLTTLPTTPPTRICKTTGKPFSHSTTVRSTPRKRAPPLAEFVSNQIAIPTSWDNVTAADKTLMKMREEGEGWEAIRKMWARETGQVSAASTLPNRYNRIKANLMSLGPGEHALLLTSIHEVDRVQKAERWGRVAAALHGRGGGKYPGEYLQKQFAAVA